VKFPLIPPGGDIENALVLEQEILQPLGQVHRHPKMCNPLQCNLLLHSQRQQLMNGGNSSLLHPLLRLNGPQIIPRNILIRGPIRKPLPLPHCNPKILTYLKTRWKINHKRKPNILSITTSISILPLPNLLNGTSL